MHGNKNEISDDGGEAEACLHHFAEMSTIFLLYYCIVLYCIVLYCIVLYCIVLYCIVLYCIVLYCIVFYCIVLCGANRIG